LVLTNSSTAGQSIGEPTSGIGVASRLPGAAVHVNDLRQVPVRVGEAAPVLEAEVLGALYGLPPTARALSASSSTRSGCLHPERGSPRCWCGVGDLLGGEGREIRLDQQPHPDVVANDHSFHVLVRELLVGGETQLP
jgi:hypothetical protein